MAVEFHRYHRIHEQLQHISAHLVDSGGPVNVSALPESSHYGFDRERLVGWVLYEKVRYLSIREHLQTSLGQSRVVARHAATQHAQHTTANT